VGRSDLLGECPYTHRNSGYSTTSRQLPPQISLQSALSTIAKSIYVKTPRNYYGI
ncbi:unnamed protein product, partial [Acidithrix sp. C25]